MNLKKIVSLLLLAFVVFYVLSFPEESSGVIKSTVSALGDAAGSFATFVKSVFS